MGTGWGWMVSKIGKSLYFQFCCNLEMILKIVLKNPRARNTVRKFKNEQPFQDIRLDCLFSSMRLGVFPELSVLLLALSRHLAEWLRTTQSTVVTG